MKLSPKLLYVFCGALLSQAAAGASLSDAKVLRMAGDDYCPYTCDPAARGERGLLVDILENLLARKGWRVEYTYLPWKRLQKDFKDGQIDLVMGGGELGDSLPSQTPISAGPACFVVAKNSAWTFNKRFDEESSLLEGRLGAVAGYGYPPDLSNYLTQHQHDGKVEVLSNQEGVAHNLLKLNAKRIDYFIEVRSVLKYFLVALTLNDKLKIGDCPYKSVKFRFYVRKNLDGAPEILKLWEQDYPKYLRSAQGQAILAKYHIDLSDMLAP